MAKRLRTGAGAARHSSPPAAKRDHAREKGTRMKIEPSDIFFMLIGVILGLLLLIGLIGHGVIK